MTSKETLPSENIEPPVGVSLLAKAPFLLPNI